MQELSTQGTEGLCQALERVLERAPEELEQAHNRLAAQMKQEVDSAIARSSIADSRGTVRDWQRSTVGTRGGYAAVRPVGSSEGHEVGPNGPGAITNYLEGGHRVPTIRKANRYYRPRIHVAGARVRGFRFYATASTRVEALAAQQARELAERIAKNVEDHR